MILVSRNKVNLFFEAEKCMLDTDSLLKDNKEITSKNFFEN